MYHELHIYCMYHAGGIGRGLQPFWREMKNGRKRMKYVYSIIANVSYINR